MRTNLKQSSCLFLLLHFLLQNFINKKVVLLFFLPAVLICEYCSTKELIRSSNWQSLISLEKLSLERYDKAIKICIKTEIGMFSFINLNKDSIIYSKFFNIKNLSFENTCLASCLLCSSNWRVEGVWMILASIAEAKSKQKTWILEVKDLLIRLIVQYIISCSIKVGMMVSFILHFCKMAIQNLCVTLPFSCSFNTYEEYC